MNFLCKLQNIRSYYMNVYAYMYIYMYTYTVCYVYNLP